MAGCLIPHTPIAVDHWRKRDTHAKICFLSHMHGDHIDGLTSSWNQTIYCSDITRSLVIEKLSVDESLIVAIPVGQSIIIPLDDEGVENMTVTSIDANHCAGAVMFLFQGYFGCILHTGDFRYFDGMLDISPFTDNIVINTLYLDNTYCDPQCEFPTRAVATKMVLEIIYNNPDKDIVFGLDNLGKEELLYEVAKDQNVPIVVDEFRKKAADLLGFGPFFTTDPEESYISVKRRREVNKHSVKMWNRDVPTIAILPTCLYVCKGDPFEKTDTIFVVPYSDHSCFSELKNFVANVKPQRIIPVVNKQSTAADSHNRADMSIFAGEKSFSSEEHTFDVPSTVLAFMSPSKNSRKSLGGRKRKATASYFNGRPKRGKGIVFSPEKRASSNKNEVNEMTVEEGVSEAQQIERETGVAALRSSSFVINPSAEMKCAKKQNEEIIAAPILPLNCDVPSELASNQTEEIVDSPMVAVDEGVQNERARKQGEEIITAARQEAGTKTRCINKRGQSELWPTCKLQKVRKEDEAKIGNEALETILLLTGLKRTNEQVNVCKLRERKDETKEDKSPSNLALLPKADETYPDLRTSMQVLITLHKQSANWPKSPNLTAVAQRKAPKGNAPSLNDSNLELGRLSPLNGHLEFDNRYPCQPSVFSSSQKSCRSSTSEVLHMYKDNESGQRVVENENLTEDTSQNQEKQASKSQSPTSSNEYEELNGAETATDRQVAQNEIANTKKLAETQTCEYDSTEENPKGLNNVETQIMVVEAEGEKEAATKVSNRPALKELKTVKPILQAAELVPVNRTKTHEIGEVDDIQSTHKKDSNAQNLSEIALCVCKQEDAVSMSDAEGTEITESSNAHAEESVNLNESDVAMSELQEDNSVPLCGTQTFMEIADELLSTHTDASNNQDLSKYSHKPLSGSEKDEHLKLMEHAKERQRHSDAKEIQCQIKLRRVSSRTKLSESQVNESDCVEGVHLKPMKCANEPLGYSDAIDIRIEVEKVSPAEKLSESPLNKSGCAEEHLKLKEHTRVSSAQEGSGPQEGSEGIVALAMVAVDPDVQSRRVNKQIKKLLNSPMVAADTDVKSELLSKRIEETIESPMGTVEEDMQCECAKNQNEERIDSPTEAVDPDVRNKLVKKSKQIEDSVIVAVDPDVQNERVDKQGEVDSPMVAVDKDLQNELVNKQNTEIIDSAMVAVNTNVQSELVNKCSEEIIDSPIAAVDPAVQDEHASKQTEEIIGSAIDAVDPHLQSELKSKEIEETTKSLMVAVDRNLKEHASKRSEKTIDSRMVAVDPFVQNKSASKQSEETSRNKKEKQRVGENIVSSTQKGNEAQSRSSDREHANVPVSNRRKPKRQRIYTGDVTFARNVLRNYKREVWGKLPEMGCTDV